MTSRELWQWGRAATAGWFDDNASSMGAALAYYTIFSLAPLLLMVTAVAGLIFGNDVAQGALLDQFEALIGSNGAQAIRAILNSARDVHGSLISIVISAITLFIGATTVFAELQRDLDLIWRAQQPRRSTLGKLLRTRLLSFGMIVGVGFLLIVSLAVSTAIAAISTLWGEWLQEVELVLHVVNFLVSFAIITVLFALIYKVLPHITIAWGDVWLGAALTSILFSLGKFLIGLYIGKSAISSSFGAAGALVVLIVWVYYSAQIFLLGAEFTYVYSYTYGSRAPRDGDRNKARELSERTLIK
jgi:membrane protein